MKLNEEMKSIIAEELAYIATTDELGNPNIGPKRTMRVLDDNHLIFSENTGKKHYENILKNGKISVAYAKRFDNKGFRFDGIAKAYTDEEHLKLSEKLSGAIPKVASIIIEIDKIYILDSGANAGELVEE